MEFTAQDVQTDITASEVHVTINITSKIHKSRTRQIIKFQWIDYIYRIMEHYVTELEECYRSIKRAH